MKNTTEYEYLQALEIGLKLASKALTRIILYGIIISVKRTILEEHKENDNI